ncbi:MULTISPECIES: hypothetical protein [Xanthomonas translucens group]|uniref:hypothetical protein n=1 Tax=Xanthomonas translucens group TaxID=3390202 RepID=UPI0019D6EF76|nr:hypothetical protein [Xanthomonas translucens]QSQ62246.1 hypothetical protein ISN38_19970 [Xanthomonas translucens pv. undulosa]WIH07072.1 hypothetical protein KHF85_20025 [Xanthomonas translucens pv. graminis]
MFRIVDIEQIVSRAKASGQARVEVEAPMLKNYGAHAVVRQATWMSGVHKDKFYAWLHVTSEGEPFYAGWGRGDQAWVKNGGNAWEWFVRERLGGEYEVVVLVVSQVNEHVVSIFEQMLEIYSTMLLNQSNFHRGMDCAALQEEHDKKAAILPFYQKVRQKKPARQIFEAAQQALGMQYDLDPWRTETGRFGEVLKAMGAYQPINTSFITFIVEWHIGQDDLSAAKAALEEFKSRAPYQASHDRVLRLDKLVEQERFFRRPQWLD